MSEMLALLKRIQWSSWSYNQQDGTETSVCPECDARFRDGHRPTCALAKMIEALPLPAPAQQSESREASAMREVYLTCEDERRLVEKCREIMDRTGEREHAYCFRVLDNLVRALAAKGTP